MTSIYTITIAILVLGCSWVRAVPLNSISKRSLDPQSISQIDEPKIHFLRNLAKQLDQSRWSQLMDEKRNGAEEKIKMNELIDRLIEMFKADFKDRPDMSQFLDQLRKRREI